MEIIREVCICCYNILKILLFQNQFLRALYPLTESGKLRCFGPVLPFLSHPGHWPLRRDDCLLQLVVNELQIIFGSATFGSAAVALLFLGYRAEGA